MRLFHLGALVCFGLALVCYFVSWAPGAWGVGIVGALFEVAAWVQVFAGPDRTSYKLPRR